MISRRTILHTLAAATLIGGSLPALAKPRHADDALQMLDTDHDGTVDLDEAKKAASTLFDKLDHDHDGTLSKDEYLTVVEQRFKAANTDNDSTLDAKELSSRAGRRLLRLLK
jgi:Ca2+-binding EF-hand superfamily protein